MNKQTVVDRIEILRDGNIQVRFAKLRVNDDGSLDGEPQWHRTVFWPGSDITTIVAQNNQHLVQMGEAEIDAACISRIIEHASVAWTAEAISAHAQRQAKIAEYLAIQDEKAKAEIATAAEAARAERQAEIDAAVAQALSRQK